MINAVVKIKSTTQYSQSRFIQSVRGVREPYDEFEKRVWRERLHGNEQGFVYIPPMQFTNSLKDAAKFMGLRIPGHGQATYTKHFEAGVLVIEPLVLPIQVSDVVGEWMMVPSDGKRGGTTRVSKCFGIIPAWSGEVTFWIMDETITQDVFLKTLQTAGFLIGIGRWRPRNGGMNGRFSVEGITWNE